MGLGLVLVGHVNFLLGALVHGAVLRHIKVFTVDQKLVYPISNVIALVAGLMVCLLFVKYVWYGNLQYAYVLMKSNISYNKRLYRAI